MGTSQPYAFLRHIYGYRGKFGEKHHMWGYWFKLVAFLAETSVLLAKIFEDHYKMLL
jgi:hypothetical protein